MLTGWLEQASSRDRAPFPKAAPNPLRVVGLGLFVCLVYMALGVLGRQAILPDAGVSFFWAPTAFGVAMVARFRGAWLFGVIPGLIAGRGRGADDHAVAN